MTFNFSESYSGAKIKELRVSENYANVQDIMFIEQAKHDAIKNLFRQGFATLERLEVAEISLEKSIIDIEMAKLNLEAIEGEISIEKRRLDDSCGQESLPIEDILKFSEIYHKRWSDSLKNNEVNYELAKKSLAYQVKVLSYKRMMHRNEYISRMELRISEFEYRKIERSTNRLKEQSQVMEDYLSELQKVIDQLKKMCHL